MNRLLHFSEDPSIEVFYPHVAATSDRPEPLVWAIDEGHAPLYWFPRQCPRVTFWRDDTPLPPAAEALFAGSSARRIHAIELGWLERVRDATLFAYEFEPEPFERMDAAAGHWVSRRAVTPVRLEPVGDLLARHAAAAIELRATPSLWPLRDAVVASGLETFSIVRIRNAQPRPS